MCNNIEVKPKTKEKNIMNLFKKEIKCVECDCKTMLKDYTKQEIYCSKCGLVLVDNSIMDIRQKEQMISQGKQQQIDYKDIRKQFHKMKKLFYNIL